MDKHRYIVTLQCVKNVKASFDRSCMLLSHGDLLIVFYALVVATYLISLIHWHRACLDKLIFVQSRGSPKLSRFTNISFSKTGRQAPS